MISESSTEIEQNHRCRWIRWEKPTLQLHLWHDLPAQKINLEKGTPTPLLVLYLFRWVLVFWAHFSASYPRRSGSREAPARLLDPCLCETSKVRNANEAWSRKRGFNTLTHRTGSEVNHKFSIIMYNPFRQSPVEYLFKQGSPK